MGTDPAGARSPGKGNEPEEQTEQLHFILFLFFAPNLFFSRGDPESGKRRVLLTTGQTNYVTLKMFKQKILLFERFF